MFFIPIETSVFFLNFINQNVLFIFINQNVFFFKPTDVWFILMFKKKLHQINDKTLKAVFKYFLIGYYLAKVNIRRRVHNGDEEEDGVRDEGRRKGNK